MVSVERGGRFLRVTAVITVAAAIAFMSLPQPALAGGQMRDCANNAATRANFVISINVDRVSCASARRFVVAINNHRIALKEHDTSYGGYFCRPRQHGAAEWIIRCTHGPRVIRWSEGT
jgi:hypothetical protein